MTRARLAFAASLLAACATLLAACGGGSGGDAVSFPTVISLGKGNLFPAINNALLALGDNRISISIIDRDDNPVRGAAVHLTFYDLNGPKPRFTSETDAVFVPVELAYVDEQSGGATAKAGESGAYIAHASFDTTGDWGVQIVIARDGRAEKPIPYRFNVQERTQEPMVSDPAPASRQITLANVADITDIDSSYPPRPQMHQQTVADALAAHRPIVLAFATPAFCRSRTCAPVMDTVMDPLYAKYGAQAAFIHIEPYDLGPLRQSNVQEPVRATREWALQGEPWVFVIGADGRVAAKFDGIMSLIEVEATLRAALAAAPRAPVPAPAAAVTPSR
jgi:hypothetical protein